MHKIPRGRNDKAPDIHFKRLVVNITIAEQFILIICNLRSVLHESLFVKLSPRNVVFSFSASDQESYLIYSTKHYACYSICFMMYHVSTV